MSVRTGTSSLEPLKPLFLKVSQFHLRTTCSVGPRSRSWRMMGAVTTRSQQLPELRRALCSHIAGLIVFQTEWRRRSNKLFFFLCWRIRMQPLLSELGSCLPLSQQPLGPVTGRWMISAAWLHCSPKAHTHTVCL